MPALLNRNNIKQAHDLAKDNWEETFNCWGATLFALGQIEELEWTDCQYMTEFLDNETEEINKGEIKIGDILAMYDWYDGDYRLIHTAVYIGNGKFWHKCGGSQSYYHSEVDVLNSYNYDDYKILRLKNN